MINLDRSPDRLAMFREQAEKLDIAFERLAAIDAATIREQRGRMTVGEIACFESHRLAWTRLVESGEPWLAVFEDDVILAPPIAPLLRSHDWIPTGVDLVKAETFEASTKVSPTGIPVEGTVLHRLLTTHCGTAGYMVSRKAAADLLMRTEQYMRPVDIAMFDPEQDSCRHLNIVQMIPALCIQERFLADRKQSLPQHADLIARSEVFDPPPRLHGAAKYGREAKRILGQIGRPRSLLRSLTPSRRLVVPFLES
ncbi:glycosyltransferase family 25 protein [Kaistia terrae]|uniref:glycosyltransferase family 25 protein n=1 Tax=Kaistia terrae TaxID=537017 RepID=UPI0036D439F2